MRSGAPPPDEPSPLSHPYTLHAYIHNRFEQRHSRRHTTMNAFWEFVDWILPPVRIVDDLGDTDYAHRPRSSHHYRDHHDTSQTRRLSGRDHDKDMDRERERRKERTLEYEREREQLRQRIQQLERENDSLTGQLRATREELSNITAALFPPLGDRTSFPASPPEPSPFVPPHSPTLPLATELPAQTRMQTPAREQERIQSRMTQYSAEAALADPKRLRVLYTSLRATYDDTRQTILSQAEELATLKSFLSKTDDWSGAQLLQALADLNSEIIQLAASVAEEFAPTLREDVRSPSAAKERDREIVKAALGEEMLRLLEDREHAGDPTLVQFALQAWEVWCVARVMDAFCYGLPTEVDEALKMIFERMQREEPQPTTTRWRALTYKHARSLLARPRPATESPSLDIVTPSPFNTAPESIASSSSLPPPLVTLTEANIRGVLAILALSGCTDARGLHRDPLRGRYGNALSRISARAERISSVVKEGVLSGLFEVVWVTPCRSAGTPKSRSTSRRSSTAPVDPPVVNSVGTNRGKGKEREWVREVERAKDEKDEAEKEAEQWFDWNTMENVYAGHCNERCRILCTVELGLAFSRKPPEEQEGESTVDGDGMVVRPSSSQVRPVSSASRSASMGGAGTNGILAGDQDGVIEGRNTDAASDAGSERTRMVRNLLLKPKVLLESVVDIL